MVHIYKRKANEDLRERVKKNLKENDELIWEKVKQMQKRGVRRE